MNGEKRTHQDRIHSINLCGTMTPKGVTCASRVFVRKLECSSMCSCGRSACFCVHPVCGRHVGLYECMRACESLRVYYLVYIKEWYMVYVH